MSISNRPRESKLIQFRGGRFNGMSKYIFTDETLIELRVHGVEQPVCYVKSKIQDGIVEWWEPAP